MTKIYLNNPDSNGCTLYRTYWPWKRCKDELAAEGIELVAGGSALGVPPTAEHDVLIFGRAPNASEVPLFYFLKKNGKRIVWDLEDNYLRIPENFHCYKVACDTNVAGVLSMTLDIADEVTVITPALGEFVANECKYTAGRITVLPNLIDCEAYPGRRNRRSADHPPRILWAGGNSHGPDLAMIASVFERLVAETNAELHLMGDVGTIPESILSLPPERCIIHGWSSARHYPPALCDLEPDIGLIPVTGTEFDAGKSAIKWMEYTLAGASVVATNFGPYAEAITDGLTGLLVPNTVDAWYEAIWEALTHKHTLQAHAVKAVRDDHSWQSPKRRIWVEYFHRLARIVGH